MRKAASCTLASLNLTGLPNHQEDALHLKHAGFLVMGFKSLNASLPTQVDFGYFGPPEEHYKWTKERREGTYVTPDDPSSEVGGEMAAALASASVALRQTDPAYADKLVAAAKQVLLMPF